jgi:hypothetical protein
MCKGESKGVSVNVMKTGEVKVQLHSFLTSELNGSSGVARFSDALGE